MGYSPTTFTDTLTLRLGSVKTVGTSMTSGSAAFTATGIVLTAADVGIPAMVFGAGPGGSPLITTVATRVDANSGTFAAAASTSITDLTIILFRAVKCRKDSIRFNTSLTSRGTASFTVLSTAGTPLVGMPVLLQDSTFGDLFGGSIDQVRRVSEPGTGKSWHECLCVSYDQLASKRTTGELTQVSSPIGSGNPLNGSFVDMPAGDIVTYLIQHALNGDGMGSVTISGPNINLGTKFEPVSAAFDRICQIASSDVDKYYWNTSPWRVVHFAKQSTVAAPWGIDDGAGTDGNVLALVAATSSRQSYVNRPINNLGQFIAEADTESYPGDGSATQFGMTRNIAAAPTVTVDGIGQTVGILSVDTGKDWYYSVGSNLITQDTGGTPLTSGNTIAVTYQGYITAVILYQNNTAVDERSGVEGGTGYYEQVTETSAPMTSSDGEALVQAIANAYGKIPKRVEIQTYRGGLEAGQFIPITLSDIGVSGSYLIDSCTLSTENNRKRWTLTAIDGALIGDWRTLLSSAAGGGSGTGSSMGGTSTGTTSAPADTTLTLTADATLSTGPQIVALDSTAANVTATLPSAASMIGQQIKVYKSVAAHLGIIEGAGSETIDGALNYTLNARWEGITLEAVSATAWKIVANAVSLSASAPTAPGVFTIGTLTYQWMTDLVLGNNGRKSTGAGLLRIFIPVTPPVSMGVTKGAHLYAEIPDISSATTARMGTALMDGTSVMQQDWLPVDLGLAPYVAGEQPWHVDLDVEITSSTVIRIYAPSYSDQIDTPLVQAGQVGASPSALLTVVPFVPGKPASGSNRTTILVTGISVTPGAVVSVGGKLRRPISVTVDLTGLPSPLPANWGYQLRGYLNGDISTDPVLVSGIMTASGLVGAGPDGILTPHTFGPEEPTSVVSVTIYAVAGLIGSSNARLGNDGPTFLANNIVPGITASAVVTYGTLTGVLDPTKIVAALLDTSVGVNGLVFGVLPLGIDTARIALLAVDTAQLAALAATAAKLATGSVTTLKVAALAIDTAALAAAAVTTAKVAAANITTALIANAAITTALIGTAQITTALIATGNITSALIGSAAIGTAAIATGAITTALIANAAITNALIANLAVGTAQIQLLAVGGAQIANASITSAHIVSLDVSKLTVTSALLVSGTAVAVQVKDSGSAWQTNMYAGSITFVYSSGVISASIGGGLGGQVNCFGTSGTTRVQLSGYDGAGANYGLFIDGVSVVQRRYTGALVTLADVIACLNYHGLH